MMRVIVILFFFIISCKPNKEVLTYETNHSNEDVIIWINNELNNVWALSLPSEFNLTNQSNKAYYFTKYKYLYSSPFKGKHPTLYKLERNNTKEKISISEFNLIPPGVTNKYILYSHHILDSTSQLSKSLKKYIPPNNTSNKIEVHNLKSHVTNNSNFTILDSLKINIINSNKNEYRKPIIIPLKY